MQLEKRKVRQEEIDLLKKLSNDLYEIPKQVADLKDGGMGSITFDIEKTESRFKQVAAAEYRDFDGVLVDIELTIDKNGKLFELDFWKVDFSPLQVYPTFEKIRIKAANKS